MKVYGAPCRCHQVVLAYSGDAHAWHCPRRTPLILGASYLQLPSILRELRRQRMAAAFIGGFR